MTIARCLLTGSLVDGSDVKALYNYIRSLLGTPYVFGYNSGASAILACLKAAGVGQGHTVVMPSFCCRSVADAVLRSGAKPVFCDIQQDLNPDVSSILLSIQANTKAIIFPHFFGRPGPIRTLEDRLIESGIRDKLLLIDDAAQSFGAKIDARYLGTFGDAGVISFGAGKMTAASGGGLLVTHSDMLSEKLRSVPPVPVAINDKLTSLIYWLVFRRWRKYSRPFYRFFKSLIQKAGIAHQQIFAIANVDAALALSQMRRLEEIIKKRKEIRNALDETLLYLKQSVPITLLPEKAAESNTKYVFFCDFKGLPRDDTETFYSYMNSNKIELQPLYPLLHKNICTDTSNCSLPVSEGLSESALNLSIDPDLSQRDILYIKNTLLAFFNECRPQSDCLSLRLLK